MGAPHVITLQTNGQRQRLQVDDFFTSPRASFPPHLASLLLIDTPVNPHRPVIGAPICTRRRLSSCPASSTPRLRPREPPVDSACAVQSSHDRPRTPTPRVLLSHDKYKLQYTSTMASNGSEEAFAPSDVLGAVKTMRGGEQGLKKQAHEYLERFQKSVFKITPATDVIWLTQCYRKVLGPQSWESSQNSPIPRLHSSPPSLCAER